MTAFDDQQRAAGTLGEDFKRLAPAALDELWQNGTATIRNIVNALMTYTTVTYAGVLDQRIAHLVANDFRVADKIRNIVIQYDADPEGTDASVSVPLYFDLKKLPPGQLEELCQSADTDTCLEELNAPVELTICASRLEADGKEKFWIRDTVIMHELVHVAINNRFLSGLHSIAAVVEKSAANAAQHDSCESLARERSDILNELVSDWLMLSALKIPLGEIEQLKPSLVAYPLLIEGYGVNEYRLGVLIVERAIKEYGEDFLRPFLGPTTGPSKAHTQRPEDTWKDLIKHCAQIMQRAHSKLTDDLS